MSDVASPAVAEIDAAPNDDQTALEALVITFDHGLSKLISLTLRAQGYRVTTFEHKAGLMERLQSRTPALIVFDLGVPGLADEEFYSNVQQLGAPTIVLSDSLKQQLLLPDAPNFGFLTKPFSVQELVDQIQEIARHVGPVQPSEVVGGTLRYGNLVLDFTVRQVLVGDQEVHLTPTEFLLLAELIRNFGEPLSHEELLTRIWGAEATEQKQYLHLHVARLRQKLESLEGVSIVTKPRYGYALVLDRPRPRPRL